MLVVDDEVEVQALLQTALAAWGYRFSARRARPRRCASPRTIGGPSTCS